MQATLNHWSHWEDLFRQKISETASADDPAHDSLHFERVVATAKALCEIENADLEVVLPAAWLHDLVNVAKNDPRRSQASRLSGEAACEYLRSIGYPEAKLEQIAHAIAAHSFSAAIKPETIEAKIVQDADRLDGLGAIGLARLFIVAGLLKRPIYSSLDPFCKAREIDDQKFTIDHVYKKLFVVADTLQTNAGRAEGARRRAVLENYLKDLARELNAAF